MKWLRYLIDRIAAWREPYCPDDWADFHDGCCRCDRILRRNVRIARYRVGKRLPRARVAEPQEALSSAPELRYKRPET